jgi:cell fate regulator YaaT (PSP1 superfamily)
MVTIVGVRFKRVGRIYYFAPNGHDDLVAGEWVIVETAKGTEAGRVVIAPRQVQDNQVADTLKPVVRRATRQDVLLKQQFRMQEESVLATCRARVVTHRLPMKLIEADYSFDGSRLTIAFTAEGRVDFRDLVKDLASLFKTRIELRQIGDRDEAKTHDGYGICGRAYCCSSWLPDFPAVSIKMAKEQDLPLNPSKITGACGRLLCCLSYENEQYGAAKHGLPKTGDEVQLPSGKATILSYNVLKGMVTVESMEGRKRLDVAIGDLPRKGAPARDAAVAAAPAPDNAAESPAAPAPTAKPAPAAQLPAASPARKARRKHRGRN